MRISTRFWAFVLSMAVFHTGNIVRADEPPKETIEQIKATFQQPGRDFSTGPLWTWNDLLTEEQIRSTMQDMASQHVKQVWVHPRPGLMTPYLSDDWFRLWGVALDEAEKLEMNVWIYDENSYPSGFAGGFVPEAMPDSRGKGLHFKIEQFGGGNGDSPPSLHTLSDPSIWYVWQSIQEEGQEEQWKCIYQKSEAISEIPPLVPGKYMIGRIQLAGSGGWFGGWWYVDLLQKGVTEKFIEITLEPYRQRFGDQFGKRLPGWFTDEPHLQTAGGLTWNEEIPVLFEQKFGYSLIDNLPSMTAEVGDWKKVRHNYQQLLLELFIDRWAKPCFEYCEKHNLEFTGHYWEHGWPGASHGPDNMAMYAWHQRPSIDTLMNQYNEGVNAQFGNARSVKELASVANQMGYNRTLSETYGAGGWDLRFEDMKRIADWQYALGVNTTNEHLSYVTLRGARKRDHPQSFSYHASWWDAYHVMADYNTRLSYALTRGEQVNHVLLIEPTSTAWMYQGHPHLGKVGNDFQNLVNQFERWQVEYDLGCEDIIARWGKVEDGKLVVNKRAYDLVILPPNMENINGEVFKLLVDYVNGEGKLVGCAYPERMDGDVKRMNMKEMLGGDAVSEMEAAFIAMKRTANGGYSFSSLGLPTSYFSTTSSATFEYELPSTENQVIKPQGKLFHHRRMVKDGELLFLCNTDMNERSVTTIKRTVGNSWLGVEQWSLETGEILPYPFEGKITAEGSGMVEGISVPVTVAYNTTATIPIDLPPCGSLLLFIKYNADDKKYEKPLVTEKLHNPIGEAKVKRLEPNVLTLDYVDVNIGGEVRSNQYFYEANRWIWQKHGWNRSPWDNEVQFKDQLITKTFPANSGFSATYRFTLADQLPNPLYIVIERPDLYAIACNGKQVTAKPGEPANASTNREPATMSPNDWWLDKAFGKVDISTAAKIGANEVTITARPMTMWHELEPAYLLGDFSLESASKGFTVKAPRPLSIVPPDNIEDIHSGDLEHVSWLTSGVGFAPDSNLKDDLSPYLIFDLGQERLVHQLKIWNYNERNLTKRGANRIRVYTALQPELPPKEVKEGEPGKPKQPTPWRANERATHVYIGEYNLRQGSGAGPETITLPQERVNDRRGRYLIIEILSNHNGVSFPIPEPEEPAEGEEPKPQKEFPDNAFVGLSEIKIIHQLRTGGYYEVEPLVVSKFSSELIHRTHERGVKHITDGSGLMRPERGWNRQGMPFYMDGVAYTQTFDLGTVATSATTKSSGKYVVTLGKWLGSVAKVIVNGEEAGYIGYAPWECDITKFVKSGRNEISVVVIGTPKNLLGPHHAGAMRGTAWPSAFWQAPASGQPSGNSYDVIGYGMFEPFVVMQR